MTKDIVGIMEDADNGDVLKGGTDASADDEMITEETDSADDDALMSSINANKKLAKKPLPPPPRI